MSGGKDFSWGLMESVDLDAWFEFTKRRLGNNCRIYLVGRDAGATACLLAAQQKEFDPSVCGIIADSPVSSLTGYLKTNLPKSTNISPDWIIWRLRKLAMRSFGFDINRCEAVSRFRSLSFRAARMRSHRLPDRAISTITSAAGKEWSSLITPSILSVMSVHRPCMNVKSRGSSNPASSDL